MLRYSSQSCNYFFTLGRLQCDRALLGAQWNGFLVAYHLQKSIGYHQFKMLMNDKNERVYNFIKCLEPIKDQAEVRWCNDNKFVYTLPGGSKKT